jgi:hypothetical protein
MKKPRTASRCFRVDEVARGCVKHQHCNREPGFFVIAIGKSFSFREDWHLDERVNPLVRQYQNTLDSVLKSNPRLHKCDVCCRHCGIRFLTHPRNAGRQDLRCPFGCREHHRKESARRRSTAYYRTPKGKREKKRRNGERSLENTGGGGEQEEQPCRVDSTPRQQPLAALPEDIQLRLDQLVLLPATVKTSPLLSYLRMVIRLIEGIRLSLRELRDMLLQAMRQHGMAYRTRTDYVLRFLHQHPP